MVGYSQWGMWVCMTIFPILQKISLKDLFCQNFIPRLSKPKNTRNMNTFLHIINIEKIYSLFYVYRLSLWKLGHGVKLKTNGIHVSFKKSRRKRRKVPFQTYFNHKSVIKESKMWNEEMVEGLKKMWHQIPDWRAASLSGNVLSHGLSGSRTHLAQFAHTTSA